MGLAQCRRGYEIYKKNVIHIFKESIKIFQRGYAVSPDATWVHCSIHWEALAAKGMPDSLKDVLDTTVKMVNFVKARPLNSRVFSALCNDMGSENNWIRYPFHALPPVHLPISEQECLIEPCSRCMF